MAAKVENTNAPTQEPVEPLSADESLVGLDRFIDENVEKPGALIPVLQHAQNLYGYLPESVLRHISTRLKVPFSEVTGVVTFYSYFSTIPRGENIIRVCLGTACYVRGGKEVLEGFRGSLGIDVGETTEDRQFSLEVGRCFGACGLAPVVMINDDVHQRVRPTRINEILAQYRQEKEAEDGE
jgi:NADH:ubiquinone oxidoreductase subunit E